MPNPQSTCAMQHTVQFSDSCKDRHITSCRALVGHTGRHTQWPRQVLSSDIYNLYSQRSLQSERPMEAKKTLHTTIDLAHAHPLDITFR